MSRRRSRVGRDPFGLSLLDMLCCSFGAVILLIVLNQQTADERLEVADALAGAAYSVWSDSYGVWKDADGKRKVERDRKAKADALAKDARARRVMYEGIGKSLPTGPAPVVGKQQFLPAAEGKRALVLLDCSGSMSRYDRNEVPPADGACPPKWARAIESIERFLLQQPDLEAFAIVAIDDGRRLSLTESRIYPEDRRRWALATGQVGLAEIGRASEALRSRRPKGGSAHGFTLEAAIREYVDADAPADVILLVTDGLPNHGIKGEAADSEAWASVADKRKYAGEAIERVRSLKGRLGSRMPPVHAFCLEWPDDTELLNFAITIGQVTGGFVVYLPSPAGQGP